MKAGPAAEFKHGTTQREWAGGSIPKDMTISSFILNCCALNTICISNLEYENRVFKILLFYNERKMMKLVG